ncbi:MAG: protein kinase [Anaerolineae bacterium]|nr:protein kinase [Anaerolineae bacterium]
MDAVPANLLVGQEVRGYRFESLIAQGGFGQVYRAFQPVVERHVAIKVILPQYANQPNFVRRFELEAQLVAQLEHPYIVPMYDYWRDASGAYLIMRLLRGSLTQLLDRIGGPLPLDTAARMLDQIAAALTAAHRNGIIHRDLKPANVLLDHEENAYLADFGIAKRLFMMEEDGDFENFGSPAYVAPEQVSGDVISAQADIYSLGIIVYEMLTGALPYDAPSQSAILEKHLTDEVPSIAPLRPDLPREVNYVIRRATQRQPKDRYANALEMAADFRRLISGATSASEQPVSRRMRGARPEEPSTPVRTVILNIAAVAQKNPYKGLRAFQEADAVDFHGRESLISRLVTRLRGHGEPSRLLALIGPSGSGKSSLVRAGLLPALRRGAVPGSNKWFFATMTPGTSPLTEFEQSIGRIAIEQPQGLAQMLREDPERVMPLIERLLAPGVEFMLFVDQFEEVFSLTRSDADRNAFLQLLVALARSSRARVIVTLRADFYDRPLLHPIFGDLLRDCTEVVLPLNVAEMEAAIVKPAERLGVSFEAGLTARIIQDVRQQPGALPLLQYVLYELFENRTGEVLTLRGYDLEGGAYGALARRAEAVYNDLEDPGRALVQKLFLRLVVVGETSDDTRRRASQSELMSVHPDRALVNKTLEAFGRHRLLTFDRDSVTREPTVEIAHEALIQHWSRLRNWIDANRALLRLRQQLHASAAEWEAGGRDPGYLARGGRLASFESVGGAEAFSLDERERGFLEASLEERQREVRGGQRRLALLGLIAAVAVGAAIIAIVLQSVAAQERDRADRQARIARANELSITAVTNLNDLDRALLLSVEAFNSADTFQARSGLLTALQYSPHLRGFLHGVTSSLRTLAVSPDGQFAAAGDADGLISIWDLGTHGEPRQWQAHDGAVYSIAFSPDGSRIVSGGNDQTVRQWDFATGAPIGAPMVGHADVVRDVAYSPDGSLIASASADTSVRLWDAESGLLRGTPLLGHRDLVFAIAFSPDGGTLASASADFSVQLWDVATGAPAHDPLQLHRNWVWDVTFSPDGRLLASAGGDGMVYLYDVQGDYVVSGNPISAHQDAVRALAFSRDGSLLATGSQDDHVRVWNVETREPMGAPFLGHDGDVWNVAFAQGNELLSAGGDGRLMIWDAAVRSVVGRIVDTSADPPQGTHGSPWARLLAERNYTDEVLDGRVSQAVFSADGSRLVSVDSMGTVYRWDMNAPEPEGQVVTALGFPLYALAVSGEGARVAVGGDDPAAYVADLDDGSALLPPLDSESPADEVYALTFSGDTLLAGDGDGQIQIWDTTSGDLRGTIETANGSPISALAVSSDGRLIAAGTRAGTIYLYDMTTLEQVRGALEGHIDWVVGLSFDSRGQTLASASHDETVRVWDVATGQHYTLEGHVSEQPNQWVTDVAYETGDTLYSLGRDGSLIAWELDVETWREQACALASRNLTPDEWARYFPGETYHETCTLE